MVTDVLPCPFCGKAPEVGFGPGEPGTEGEAWGAVTCMNELCPARPSVEDGKENGEDIADDCGPEAYRSAAVRRWNRRVW